MKMAKYILKRFLLMFFVLFVIVSIAFILVRMLERPLPDGNAAQQEIVKIRWTELGYFEPILVQYGK